MVEPTSKTIDGRVIMTVPFLGRRALTYKTKIIRMFGASIGSLFSKPGGINAQIDFSVFEDFITKLTARIDENEFVKFVLELLQTTRIDGKEITPETFDMEFAANLVLMYKILWFVLEVNYGNFFGDTGIGKILSALKAKTPLPVAK